MWIIPSTHQLYSVFAQECVVSKEELSAQSDLLEQSLMWRSKPSSLKIWCARWNRVYWLPHLFSRMLKPSPTLHTTFAIRFTESLPDIRASHSPTPATVQEPTISDTFFLLYTELCKQLSLFGDSSKTSPGTSHWDMTKFTEAYEIWGILLRQEYFQRLRRVLHIRESDYLSLQSFPTPCTASAKQGQNEPDGKRGQTLIGAARNQNWVTPTTDHSLTSPEDMRSTAEKKGYKNGTQYKNLASQMEWRTPQARNNKSADPENSDNFMSKMENGRVDLNSQVFMFPTPRQQNHTGTWAERKNAPDLQTFVLHKMFPTPTTDAANERMDKYKQGGTSLSTFIQSWATPRSSEFKGTGPKGSVSQKYRLDKMYLDAQVEEHQPDSLPPPEANNTTGKRLVLSPRWVAQLMGTTLEKIFFACSEMEW